VNENLGFEAAVEAVFFDFEVVAGLEVEPEALGGAEVAGEAEGGVGGDGALAVDDLVDAAGWHGDVLGEAVLGDVHGVEELFEKDLAGVDGRVGRWFVGHGGSPNGSR